MYNYHHQYNHQPRNIVSYMRIGTFCAQAETVIVLKVVREKSIDTNIKSSISGEVVLLEEVSEEVGRRLIVSSAPIALASRSPWLVFIHFTVLLGLSFFLVGFDDKLKPGEKEKTKR